MIDPHVHLRDWKEKNKETVKHGIEVMHRCGLDGAIEECNTKTPLTCWGAVAARLELADKAIEELGINFFHSVYMALTGFDKQMERAIATYHEFFPRVAGFKLFPGQIPEKSRRTAFRVLADNGYTGVVQSHCEKESFLRPDLWESANPVTHSLARSPFSETAGIMYDIDCAKQADFKGKLIIAHTSVPTSVKIIEEARKYVDFDILIEGAPHHFILYDKMMGQENGIGLKMNPPLRPREMQEYMLQALLDRRIDQIGTDHAPHQKHEKFGEPYCSGIPGHPLYSVFIQILKEKGMSQEALDAVTHDNIIRNYGFPEDLVLNTRRAGTQSLEEINQLRKEYPVDVVSFLS